MKLTTAEKISGRDIMIPVLHKRWKIQGRNLVYYGIRRKPYTLKNRIKLSKKDRDIIQSLDGKHSLEHYNKDNLKINFPKESSPMPPRKLHYRNRLMMRYSVKNVSQWFYTSSTGDIIRGVVGLILLGSTLYYFKSGQQIMKIISTIGCISILIILCLLKLMA